MAKDKKITHLNEKGEANMVDITSKEMSHRIAVARASIQMKKETLNLLKEEAIKKGDVLSVARVAGIMASKQTPNLIPLCHPLSITKAEIEFEVNEEKNILEINATIETYGKTGVEMEALTAASVSSLTVYDMCKAVDKGMTVTIGLVSKKGGKSGERYKMYKKFTTFDEVDTAVDRKKMHRDDLRFDVVRGICKLIEPRLPIPAVVNDKNELEAIEAHISTLQEDITPINPTIGPIERLYDLRSGVRTNETITEGDWNSKLTNAAHMACVMGWDDKGTQNVMQEFALSTINEIVCGKTTPLTMSEAKRLPEWESWMASMTKEFKALQDMGVFELVKRSDLPKRSRVVKTKWVYKIK